MPEIIGKLTILDLGDVVEFFESPAFKVFDFWDFHTAKEE
jgi:hypothetical protein